MSFQYASSDGSTQLQCNLTCQQCLATSERTGEQCKRTSCRYLPYCSQHTKSKLGLEVKPSTIPEAGNGLFAVKNFHKGDKISEYIGRILTKSQIDALYGTSHSDLSPYAVKVSRDLYIDASCFRSIAAFANYSPSKNNAELATNYLTNQVFLWATKNIPMGSEIFTDYGREYFLEDGPKPVFSTSSRKLNKSQPETVIPEAIHKPKKIAKEGKEGKEGKDQHSWDHSRLEVKDSLIEKAGKGLFAKKTIAKNEIITCIDHPVVLGHGGEDAQDAGFPHDSVVWFKPAPRQPEISVFDTSWTNPSNPPKWYFMNHGQKEANAELLPTKTKYGPSVCWKAKRKIEKSEEIIFNYDVGHTVKFFN
jgi:hypothetical protein